MRKIMLQRQTKSSPLFAHSSHLGSFSNILNATNEDLIALPGIGPKKAQQLQKIFHQKWA